MVDRVFGRNFGRIPDELLWDPKVPAEACRLYAALTRYGQQRDRIVPGRKELAERLGWSLDKLDRHTRKLVAAGALLVEPRYGQSGRQEESAYWIDGRRPGEGRTDAAGEGRTDAANDGRTDAAPNRAERGSASTKRGRRPAGSQARAAKSEEHGTTANTILAAWIDRSRLNGQLTEETRGRLGSTIKRMLSRKTPVPEPAIAAALDEYAAALRRPDSKIQPTHFAAMVDKAMATMPKAPPLPGQYRRPAKSETAADAAKRAAAKTAGDEAKAAAEQAARDRAARAGHLASLRSHLADLEGLGDHPPGWDAQALARMKAGKRAAIEQLEAELGVGDHADAHV